MKYNINKFLNWYIAIIPIVSYSLVSIVSDYMVAERPIIERFDVFYLLTCAWFILIAFAATQWINRRNRRLERAGAAEPGRSD